MNKYVLLCAAFLCSLACLMNAECDKDCKGRELAADMMRKTVRAANENAETRSCSSCCGKCGKCKTCSKCCCKSVMTEEEATQSCTKSCSSCGKCCGKCTSCKSAEIDEDTRCACGKPKPKSEKIDMRDAKEDAA